MGNGIYASEYHLVQAPDSASAGQKIDLWSDESPTKCAPVSRKLLAQNPLQVSMKEQESR